MKLGYAQVLSGWNKVYSLEAEAWVNVYLKTNKKTHLLIRFSN
jgi:hypothetical protein